MAWRSNDLSPFYDNKQSSLAGRSIAAKLSQIAEWGISHNINEIKAFCRQNELLTVCPYFAERVELLINPINQSIWWWSINKKILFKFIEEIILHSRIARFSYGIEFMESEISLIYNFFYLYFFLLFWCCFFFLLFKIFKSIFLSLLRAFELWMEMVWRRMFVYYLFDRKKWIRWLPWRQAVVYCLEEELSHWNREMEENQS